MLPLWIIDLTQSSDRRDHLLDLIGQTDGVYCPDRGGTVTDGDYCWIYTRYDSFQDNKQFDLSECDDRQTEQFGEWVYSFQDRLVHDGGEYVKMIRHSSLHAYTTLNVCVLGDATEAFTQLLFPSVALLLQKEKGRMLANHIHQGFSVIGALFVPSSINSNIVDERERLLRTLMEVDVQYQVSTVRGYDHMLLYQDVQNRVDKYYPLLDAKGQAEYIYQCLIHLYFASNTQHPLISGVAAADNFYLSMGASSVYFDEGNQDMEVSCDVANNLLRQFFAEPKSEDLMMKSAERRDQEKKQFIPDNSISIERILTAFTPTRIELSDDLPAPYPDPYANFTHKYLKRRYYNEYLTTRLADFRRLMNDNIEKSTRGQLEWVHATFNRHMDTLQDFQFPEGIRRFVERCNNNDGGLYWLESMLKSLRERAGENKKRIPDYVNRIVWENVFQLVEKKYSDAFHDYHNAYLQDINSKTAGHYADEMKSSAIDNLCNHLKQETPVLSRVVRSFLVGIVAVLAILPILNFLSPLFINLGHIRQNAFPWTVGIFMIPVLVEIFFAIRYLVKRDRKERRLRGFYLHDAYARVANRIITEANNFYDKVMQLCGLYLQRAETIRMEVNDIDVPAYSRKGLPETMFNQPLVEGTFNGQKMLRAESLEPKKIYINHIQKQTDELYPDDYFSLIHLFKDDFIGLFGGIMIPEMHPVEKEKGTGTVRLLSADEVKERQRQEWGEIRRSFSEALPSLIKEELVPLVYPSASGMVLQHFKRTRKVSFMKPFIQYAAPNGEFITSANPEQVDVKTLDDKTRFVFAYYLPEGMVFQEEPGGDDVESQAAASLYKKYIFLTRWIGFDNLALNRILPMEDFDIEEKKRQVNEEERDGKKRQKVAADEKEVRGEYPVASSSAVLWSLCEGDNSILWLKLFHSNVLADARKKSGLIKRILTQKD